MKLKYQIVVGRSAEELHYEVQFLLARGWALQGGVSVQPESEFSYRLLLQAMVFPKPKKDK